MHIPYDGSVEAEYSDGYIHSETELEDVSPYDNTKNVFNDILEKRPEPEHGKMVRFSVFNNNSRHDVMWQGLPDNARPIRYRDFQARLTHEGPKDKEMTGLRFGYQYNDASGKNHQEIREI